MDKVLNRPGPATSRDVRPVRVSDVSPRFRFVVPMVKSFEDIIVELASKFAGLKLTFSKSVICPKVSIEIFFG